jgi:hypothetical protein
MTENSEHVGWVHTCRRGAWVKLFDPECDMCGQKYRAPSRERIEEPDAEVIGKRVPRKRVKHKTHKSK